MHLDVTTSDRYKGWPEGCHEADTSGVSFNAWAPTLLIFNDVAIG